MSEPVIKDQEKQNSGDDLRDDIDAVHDESRVEPSLWERMSRFMNSGHERRHLTTKELSKDRTQSLRLLIAGIVGAILLFFGVFSTPRAPWNQENRSHSAPNLGRPATAEQQTAPMPKSVTPLLNADLRPDELKPDLSPADIRATSQRSRQTDEDQEQATIAPVDSNMPRIQKQRLGTGLISGPERNHSDPLAAFLQANNSRTSTYRYGGSSVTDPVEMQQSFGYGSTEPKLRDVRPETRDQAKSSIVFVRPVEAAQRTPNSTESVAVTNKYESPLLPPGTRLLARLEAASTTALKTPVVASIEYNYERDGVIVIRAGSKVIGELQQASSEGYVSLRFHTLQLGDGREEKIEGVAMDLNYRPLKGTVSGKNTGKKILSRTLSGVGTIASYVVGGSSVGLSRTITGETLLRDRLAGNIALAGEQELMNAASSQNIAVTLPANIRFYVVMQKPVIESTKPVTAGRTENRPDPIDTPTVQELRELMDIKREINRAYLESSRTPADGMKP